MGKVEIVSPSCDACVTHIFGDTFIQRGVRMGNTTLLLKKTARQIVGALRTINTLNCAGIYFAENSSKSNSMCMVLVVDQAALYTRTSPVT